MKSWHEQAVEVGCQILDLAGTREFTKLAILTRRNERIVRALGQEGGIAALIVVLEEVAEKRPKHKAGIQEQIASAKADQEELEILDELSRRIRAGEFPTIEQYHAYLDEIAAQSAAGERVRAVCLTRV